jgi:hypothetical protein
MYGEGGRAPSSSRFSGNNLCGQCHHQRGPSQRLTSFDETPIITSTARTTSTKKSSTTTGVMMCQANNNVINHHKRPPFEKMKLSELLDFTIYRDSVTDPSRTFEGAAYCPICHLVLVKFVKTEERWLELLETQQQQQQQRKRRESMFDESFCRYHSIMYLDWKHVLQRRMKVHNPDLLVDIQINTNAVMDHYVEMITEWVKSMQRTLYFQVKEKGMQELTVYKEQRQKIASEEDEEQKEIDGLKHKVNFVFDSSLDCIFL